MTMNTSSSSMIWIQYSDSAWPGRPWGGPALGRPGPGGGPAGAEIQPSGGTRQS